MSPGAWCYRVVIICMVLLFIKPAVGFSDNLDDEIRSLESLSKTYHLIQSQYIESRTVRQLVRSAVEGMVSSLDPYSEAFNREELKNLESQATGKFAGIGISIQNDASRHVVIQVVKGSPSEKAGLTPGDILVQLNGVKLTGQKETDLSRLVRGEVGSRLTISFYHPEKPDEIIKRSIIREMIKFPSVVHFEVGPSTIVIQIQQFQKNTPDEIVDVLNRKPYGAVVLDLRNNPGGLFLAAVETADLFIDGGDIVETRDKENRLIERYVSRKNSRTELLEVVVMINRHSASSAEIVAGAIKDRGVGLIVGEKSYGKGVVQTIFPLGEDLFVKLTTARYFTPSGISFHEVGIEPDYPIEDSIGITRYGSNDQIYQKSLDLIGKPKSDSKVSR